MEKLINLTLQVWRQKNAQDEGRFVTYEAKGVSTEMSFLEMLDVVNEGLILKGEEPIAMDHDCREGICGQCGLVINGKETPTHFHRELGKIMWENCGMGRNEAGLKKALQLIPELRQRFWEDVKVPGSGADLNQSLELAGRVGDFLELSELMCLDALERRESCGGHFREEWQTPDGEALRDDENFCHVAAWEHMGEGKAPKRHVEELHFENVHLATRSYK